MNYDFKATEQKWQSKWEEAKVFEAQDNSDKPKFFSENHVRVLIVKI